MENCACPSISDSSRQWILKKKDDVEVSGWIKSCRGFLRQVWGTNKKKKKKEKNSQSDSTQAHTHLVCHLSELENDGSYQIETRQHIKTAVSPPPLSVPLSVCSLSSPVCLASIISPNLFHHTESSGKKGIKTSSLAQTNSSRG